VLGNGDIPTLRVPLTPITDTFGGQVQRGLLYAIQRNVA